MLADTAAVRALGGAYTAHAADLIAVSAALHAIPTPAAALGPVGARFVAAFADAVADQTHAIATLGADARAAADTAARNAISYESAGHRAAGLLPQV